MNLLSACLSVADLDASIAWYQTTLGFRVVQPQAMPQHGYRLAFLAVGRIELEMVQDDRFTPSVRPDPLDHTIQQGISQLTFWVTDVKQWLAELKRKGVPITFDLVQVEDFGLRAFFSRDNDGNLIEFKERYLPPELTNAFADRE